MAKRAVLRKIDGGKNKEKSISKKQLAAKAAEYYELKRRVSRLKNELEKGLMEHGSIHVPKVGKTLHLENASRREVDAVRFYNNLPRELRKHFHHMVSVNISKVKEFDDISNSMINKFSTRTWFKRLKWKK